MRLRRAPLFVVLALGLVTSCHKDKKKPAPAETEQTASPTTEQPHEAAFEDTGPNRFRVQGAENSVIVRATAAFSRSADGALRQLDVSAPPEYQRRNGRSYNVYMYFPPGFQPKPGTYPIAADYRKRSDAFGGGVLVQSQAVKLFGYEAKGDVTFTSFGQQSIAGRFHFSVQDAGRGSKDPKTLTVGGQFEATAAVKPPAEPAR